MAGRMRRSMCRRDDPFFLARVMAALPRQVPRFPSPVVRGWILAVFYAVGIGVAIAVFSLCPPRFVDRIEDAPGPAANAEHSCFWAPLGELYDLLAGPHPETPHPRTGDWALWGLAVGVALVATGAHTRAR